MSTYRTLFSGIFNLRTISLIDIPSSAVDSLTIWKTLTKNLKKNIYCKRAFVVWILGYK